MLLSDETGDIEPQSAPPLIDSGGKERFAQMRQKLGRDADPFIADLEDEGTQLSLSGLWFPMSQKNSGKPLAFRQGRDRSPNLLVWDIVATLIVLPICHYSDHVL